jgi:hypothetical protein
MEAESNSQGQASVLEWAVAAIGAEGLGYLVGRDSADIPKLVSGEEELSEVQSEIIDALSLLRRNMPSELDEDSINEAVRGWLMQVNQGRTVAGQMHEHVSGLDASPTTNDELERTVCTGFRCVVVPAETSTTTRDQPVQPHAITSAG